MTVNSPFIEQYLSDVRGRLFIDVGPKAIGMPGWTVLDMHPRATVQHDPLDLPWPFESSTAFYIRCLNFVEHIPKACPQHPADPLLELFEEFWRLLKPGGRVWITCPHSSTPLMWGDPTTRRALNEDAFQVASKQIREARGLAKLPLTCDFHVTHGFVVNEQAELREMHVEMIRPERST